MPNFCQQCGTKLTLEAPFCGECGASTAGFNRTSPPPIQRERLTWQIPIVDGLPLTLWVVVALYAIPGAYLVWIGIRPLPDLVSSLGDPGGTLVVAFFVLFLLVSALGVGLLAIAYLLYQADRVGRGLAYVAAGMMLTEVVFGSATSTGVVLVMLAALGAAAALAFEPNIQSHFTGLNAHQRDEPSGVVVARVIFVVAALLLALFGILDLLLGSIDNAWYALGVLFLVLATGAIIVARSLRAADRRARIAATVGAVAGAILLLIGTHAGGFVLGIGLMLAVPISLWVPTETRQFFGDAPLLITTTADRS